MEKSLDLKLYSYFKQESSSTALKRLQQQLHLRHAEVSYWKQGEEEALLQQFDGLHGFLYHLDIAIEAERCIPLVIGRADLHILYLFSSEGHIQLYQSSTGDICSIASERARYLYLPKEEYILQLPRGKSQLFGFYFSGNVFRRGNERPYDFLYSILEHYRAKSAHPISSLDFRVGSRTRNHIETLCKKLDVRQLDNESFIFQQIIALIKLSKEKVDQDQSKVARSVRIAIEAHHVLQQFIQEKGQLTSVVDLQRAMRIEASTINKHYKSYFGRSLRSARLDMLIERAKLLLQTGLTPSLCAYELQYSAPEAFYHFFKHHTGLSPSQFLEKQKKESENY
ncbi:helix-turn-helix domain-containing protein [Sphingobacterium sp. LRF_L2]|uniref:AraC family transcriptional regulator n=1 Tax=Sphingobacterium sp. LRF_L2 TaxID=3369421 RepID=UPI003F5DF751